jgi:hypothetical protein
MPICVTCSNHLVNDLLDYCQQHAITTSSIRYIAEDSGYWVWRIDSLDTAAVTWLLLHYPYQLTRY